MSLKQLPSVDLILKTPEASQLITVFGYSLTIEAVQVFLSEFRNSYTINQPIPDRHRIILEAQNLLMEWLNPSLVPVINATGVILHTNLGRAPLSQEAIQSINDISAGYCSLEYELSSGKRGSRSTHAESLLTKLTGAESALVVNNNAAAVLLALSALANRRRVVISRSQLVEIGGSFRIPDVMRQSGARLVEVGATNRVHLKDYEEALQQPTAMLLHAHHSNFRIIGFTHEPSISEIVTLAEKYHVPVMDDVGSGTLLDTQRFGLTHEPTVQESVRAGVPIVCFSGDKLLGGPQAGIIVGNKIFLDKIKKHPLARAVRADKLCLAALTTTLQHYLRGEAETKIPIWRMLSMDREKINQIATTWLGEIGVGQVIDGMSTIGGGSLPEEQIPTRLLALNVKQPNLFLARLRNQTPPIIARIEKERVVFDPRTVLPGQSLVFLQSIKKIIADWK